MRFSFLLILFLFSLGIVNAQDTIRTLIISEARLDSPTDSYIEITNVGDETINLSQFKVGELGAYQQSRVYDPFVDPITPRSGFYLWLPDYDLEAGESFIIKNDYDFGPRQYKNKVPGFEGKHREIHPKWYDLADLMIDMPETGGDETDKVSDLWRLMSDNYSGRNGFYIEQHLNETDSVTIDQVGGVFDNDGKNFSTGRYDVAGVAGATATHTLVRKYSIKKGNPDFANARGNAPEDSEWMPLPLEPERGSKYREPYWTIGNHGNYQLDANTLVPTDPNITVDFAAKKITVPYYIRRSDGIMQNMEEKPGIAWRYLVSPAYEDTLAFGARTGDKLVVFVLGNDLDVDTFDVVVSEPAEDANIVLPVINQDVEGNWRKYYTLTNLVYEWPWVSENESGIDTITGTWYGIPYATRVDSLLDRLEKPANATWEFVWVDGVARPDLKDGDKLKVTAANGTAKEYHIEVQPYNLSKDAALSTITWPDIPEELKGIFGWKGDTLPNFGPSTFNYRIEVPFEYEGIPALVAKTSDLNANLEVQRATSLSGSVAERTVKFIVTAEDGTVNTYSVELVKEQSIDNIQPYYADPFISELVNNAQWRNRYMEIVNPGNQPLDLSDYMIVSEWGIDDISGITRVDSWPRRYNKYVPGYKWVDESTWAVAPVTLEVDLSVNAIVQPGETFVLGTIREDNIAYGTGGKNLTANEGWKWMVPEVMNVQFATFESPVSGITYDNPWGETLEHTYTPAKIGSCGIFFYKILNDSVKNGLKPATDPRDFELIESIWNNGQTMLFGGTSMPSISTVIRKPEIYKGNKEHGATFGTTPEDSEWTMISETSLKNEGVSPTSKAQLYVENDIGKHYMIAPTHYKSTVTSSVYKVSLGYSQDEEIRGPRLDETVEQFKNNLIKANEEQSLEVMRGDTKLDNGATLNDGDVLVVVSADSVNTSKYNLSVTEEGLSSNALLTSALYEIDVNEEEGTISGFEYGTLLKTVVENVTVPEGASMMVIDGNNAYVPFKKLNFDTAYVQVAVTQDIYFEVVAENGTTKIVYQLQPAGTEDDAFIVSDIYEVAQNENLVKFVPRGTNVQSFLNNVVPSTGASVKIVNKAGQERTDGNLFVDDKVVVTSANNMVTKVYHLAMLNTQYIQGVDYLAFVLSNTYDVDQLGYEISGTLSNASIDEFETALIPAPGASFVVVDSEGNEKSSGELAEGDQLKVTSADQKIVVMYTIDMNIVSVDQKQLAAISIYPNPTTGELNVKGIESGSRVQIFNTAGAIVRDVKVNNNLARINIDNQPAGIYLIVISNDKQMVGQYKVIKK